MCDFPLLFFRFLSFSFSTLPSLFCADQISKPYQSLSWYQLINLIICSPLSNLLFSLLTSSTIAIMRALDYLVQVKRSQVQQLYHAIKMVHK